MPHRVGRLIPNVFGLYDMHGNLWEHCEDWWDVVNGCGPVGVSSAVDPVGPGPLSERVIREGAGLILDSSADQRSEVLLVRSIGEIPSASDSLLRWMP